jgi:hypothetical protein
MSKIKSRVKSTKYKHVYFNKGGNRKFKNPTWYAVVTRGAMRWSYVATDELDAAKAVDKFLIGKGEAPINNILVKREIKK